ncbi:MAG TPA: hypothetical protein PLL02_05255 [Bacteroidales bacterium]|nr:hypothetical protein [Bacteroidales bacterium]
MKGILVDDNGELIIGNGTLKIGDVQVQLATHLIVAFTGEYKHAPLIGGNAKKMIAGSVYPFWVGDVKRQLKQCLVNVESFELNNGVVEVEIKE